MMIYCVWDEAQTLSICALFKHRARNICDEKWGLLRVRWSSEQMRSKMMIFPCAVKLGAFTIKNCSILSEIKRTLCEPKLCKYGYKSPKVAPSIQKAWASMSVSVVYGPQIYIRFLYRKLEYKLLLICDRKPLAAVERFSKLTNLE